MPPRRKRKTTSTLEPPTLRTLGADTNPVQPPDRDDEILAIEWPSTGSAFRVWQRFRRGFESQGEANRAEKELSFVSDVEMMTAILGLLHDVNGGNDSALDRPIRGTK